MNVYKKTINLLILIFIMLSPLLPSYGKISSDIILYLLVLLQVIGFVIFKKERKLVLNNLKIIFKDKIFLSLLVLNTLMYFSTIVALDKRSSITHSIRFTLYLFIFYLISYSLKNMKQLRAVFFTFLTTSIIVSIISLIQVASIIILGNHVDMHHRITSTLENPNNLGAYSILLIFIFIMILIKAKNRNIKIIFGISTLLLLFNIIVSQSRNALLALVAGILLVFLLYNKRYIIFSVIFPVILFIIPQTRVRILDIFDMSQNSSRLNIWKLTKIMINNDKQLFGIGYENYGFNYPIYLESNPSYFVRESLKPLHPHNALLKFQVELGVFGSIAFILFLAISIFTLYKIMKNENDELIKVVLIGGFVGFVAFQSMNILDSYYGTPKVMVTMFILLAIINGYKRIRQNKSNIF
ncbi:O-antigen ligase family protein [Clostridium carnis]